MKGLGGEWGGRERESEVRGLEREKEGMREGERKEKGGDEDRGGWTDRQTQATN